jgi:hypothetical protein
MSSLQDIESLNNTGVALLAVANYKHAINAFRAASALLKIHKSGSGHLSSKSPSVTPACVQAAITQATTALATSTTTTTNRRMSFTSSSSCVLTVQPLQYTESDVADYLSVMQYGPSLSVIHPIVIPSGVGSVSGANACQGMIATAEWKNDPANSINMGSLDESMLSIVLAYNHGLAYYCISRSKKSSKPCSALSTASKAALSHANGHLQRAHEQLVALSMAQSTSKSSSQPSLVRASSSSLMLLSVEGVVLNTLSQTLMEEGCHDKADAAYTSVNKIRSAIERQLKSLMIRNRRMACSTEQCLAY